MLHHVVWLMLTDILEDLSAHKINVIALCVLGYFNTQVYINFWGYREKDKREKGKKEELKRNEKESQYKY
jgi:hypothetical protein